MIERRTYARRHPHIRREADRFPVNAEMMEKMRHQSLAAKFLWWLSERIEKLAYKVW